MLLMVCMLYIMIILFSEFADPRDLHVLTHSSPTRRTTDRMAPPLRLADESLALAQAQQDASRASLLPQLGESVSQLRQTTNPSTLGRSEEHTSELQPLMRI